ncbi:hypothetical protein [Thermomonas haemolytica]|uniref:hypothetical protein n=1 Tax=Thermomonas haemolytica TaxID=141949 RepID=UPI001051F3B7|nr:hypothetical protein [Thermomonas haemolytica]
MRGLVQGGFELPAVVEENLACGKWRYWSPVDSPFVARKSKSGRIEYAHWLKAGGDPLDRKGVYIWLAKRPGGSGWRFVHVGISTKGASSLAKRTMTHIRNQFTVDRVHELKAAPNDQGLGSLGEPINDEGRFDAAERFLKSLRVLYLVPEGSGPVDPVRIRKMEGIIARAASYLFNRRGLIRGVVDSECEITNTLSKVARYDFQDRDAHFVEVAKALNCIEPMLPVSKMCWDMPPGG